MTQHLTYGGSTAARTIGCPSWIRLSEDMPKGSGSNEAADTGTLLHTCMEEILGGTRADKLLEEGREYNGIKLTSEMIFEKLDPAGRAISALGVNLHWPTGPIRRLEPFVKISDEIGGSIDVLYVSEDGKTVQVIDYKFGHVAVSAVDNKQLQFYALCADVDESTQAMFERCETIAMTIIQPNDNGPDYETWSIPYEQLSAFEDELMDAIELSKTPDAEPKAGDWCKYCPAHSVCPIKTGTAMTALRINDLTKVDALENAMSLVAEVEAWAKEVKKVAHEQMAQGVTLAGFKLVGKRAARVWNDAPAIEKKLRNMRRIKNVEAWDSKLKTPPQLEKLCYEKRIDFKEFAPYISSVSSGTTVAKASDKRREVTPLAGLEALNAMLD